MHKKLLIVGAGGHGKVIADIAMNLNIYHEIVFLDDNIDKRTCMSCQVVGTLEDINNYISDHDIIIAIGNANVRKKMMEDLIINKASIPTLIHPRAIIGANVEFGCGTVVMAGAILNPDAKIGNGCIINTAATVDHDCEIGDYVHISVGSHLAGNVKVNGSTWIGIGSTISNNLSICDNVTIGAGAVVVKDIIESGTYVGVPAKKIK